MDILQYIADHHDQFFYVIAGLSFILELTITGMSGPLLFFAIGSFVTGVLIGIGLISGWEVELFVLGLLTVSITVLLWKPLKRFQDSGGGADTSSDMIGRQVPAASEITEADGSIRYSGINWNSRLDDGAGVASIAEGDSCVISSVDGNVMLVKPLSS